VGKCGLDASGSELGTLRVLVHVVMNLLVPLNVGNFLAAWVTTSFSRRALSHGVH
jgi:hypothetical protein